MTEIHTEELLDRLAAEALPDEPAPLGALVAAAEAGRRRHIRRRRLPRPSSSSAERAPQACRRSGTAPTVLMSTSRLRPTVRLSTTATVVSTTARPGRSWSEASSAG